MKIYAAAVYTNSYMNGQNRYVKLNDFEKLVTRYIPNILESYHYIKSQKIVDQMREDGASVFLDSGAFSAFTLNATIDLLEYCNFILQNMDLWRKDDNILTVSVLDGIGDPLKTYQNQIAMEEAGVKPLPCFHFGEDDRYLQYYISNYEYITIGGMVGRKTDQLITWLDRIWDKFLISGTGAAKLKVHAFGITSNAIMERYPWHSVDSSSWIQSAAFGNIMFEDGSTMSVSGKSPARHVAGQHITTLSDLETDVMTDKIKKLGFDPDRLSDIYESRAVFNLGTYIRMNQRFANIRPEEKFKNIPQELF